MFNTILLQSDIINIWCELIEITIQIVIQCISFSELLSLNSDTNTVTLRMQRMQRSEKKDYS